MHLGDAVGEFIDAAVQDVHDVGAIEAVAKPKDLADFVEAETEPLRGSNEAETLHIVVAVDRCPASVRSAGGSTLISS